MKIIGIQKQSLVEYPGKISTVIFLGGCNFRCPWCYVPHLALPERIKKEKKISKKEIFDFLKKRRKFIDVVAISGGEPTINKELPNFIKEIKKLGYLVEIETNGTNSKMLKFLIGKKLVDYVALDIKQDLDFKKYSEVVGGVLNKVQFIEIQKSINLLLSSSIDYEFRTTIMKEFHKKEDIIGICKKISGAKIYYLQNFAGYETISKKTFTPFDETEIKEIIMECKKFVNIKFRKYL